MEADTLRQAWEIAATVVTSLLTGVVVTSVLVRRRSLQRASDRRALLADQLWRSVDQICVAVYPHGTPAIKPDELHALHEGIKTWYSEYGAYLTAEEDQWARHLRETSNQGCRALDGVESGHLFWGPPAQGEEAGDPNTGLGQFQEVWERLWVLKMALKRCIVCSIRSWHYRKTAGLFFIRQHNRKRLVRHLRVEMRRIDTSLGTVRNDRQRHALIERIVREAENAEVWSGARP